MISFGRILFPAGTRQKQTHSIASHTVLRRRGFTLLELLIVISLFVIMSLILVVGWEKQTQNTLGVNNLAYEIAQVIREAQILGVSVVGTESGDFTTSYGIHFDTDNRNKFLLYADTFPNTSPNNKYDAGDDALVREFMLRDGYTITNVCGENTSGTCVGGSSVKSVEVLFERPFLEPDIRLFGGGGEIASGVQKTRLNMTVSSPGGEESVVVITHIGQIYVE